MGYVYGYARESTDKQDLNRQLKLLRSYTCNEILTEKMNSTKSHRPELEKLKVKVHPGDTLVVESFAKLARSTKDLIELVEFFEAEQVKLISHQENFDTTTEQGKQMMKVFHTFSQFERELIVERTKEGLENAKEKGRRGGRPRLNKRQIDAAIKMYESKSYSVKEIEDVIGISKSTLYRYLKQKQMKSN